MLYKIFKKIVPILIKKKSTVNIEVLAMVDVKNIESPVYGQEFTMSTKTVTLATIIKRCSLNTVITFV